MRKDLAYDGRFAWAVRATYHKRPLLLYTSHGIRTIDWIDMANVNVTIRMDDGLKEEADELFEELGMSFTTAINVFVKQAVREGRIPFEVTTAPKNTAASAYALVEVPTAAS